MSYITQDQIKHIVSNAPQGHAPSDVIQSLANRGHIIEGYNDPTIPGATNVSQMNNPWSAFTGVLHNAVNWPVQAAKTLYSGPVKEAAGGIGMGLNALARPFGQLPFPNAGAAYEEGAKNVRGLAAPLTQTAGMAAEGVNSLLSPLGAKPFPGAERVTAEGVQGNLAYLNKIGGVSNLTDLPLGIAERGVNRLTGSEVFSQHDQSGMSPASVTKKQAVKAWAEDPVGSLLVVSSALDMLGKGVDLMQGTQVNPALQQTAQSLGTTPERLIQVVRQAGSDVNAIDAALQKNFAGPYQAMMDAAQQSIDEGGSIGALDIPDPLRKAVFGDKATGIAPQPSAPGALPFASQSLGGQLQSIGGDVNPLNYAAKAGNAVLEQGRRFGKSLYQSALKPTKAVTTKFPDVVQTGLNEGVVVSGGGQEKVQGIIDDLDSQIGDAIKNSKEKGVVVLPQDVVQRLDDAKEFFGKTVGGSKTMQELDDLATSFKAEHLKDGYTYEDGAYLNPKGKEVPYQEAQQPIPIEEAQALKRNTNALLKKSYGEMKTVDIEGTKGIVRGLKEEIAKQLPQISGLNQRMGNLIGLDAALDDFVRRQKNHNLLGIAGETALGAGSALGAVMHNVPVASVAGAGLLAALAKKFIESPTAKSILGIQLNRLGPLPPLPPEAGVVLGGQGSAPQRRFRSR